MTNAREINYLENFALAEDREKALQELIPGSEDYYYFHCLHYQNENQQNAFSEMMQKWKKRVHPGVPARMKELENRQALLDFKQSPASAYDRIKDELNIRFGDQKRDPNVKPTYSSQLDPAQIRTESFKQRALKNSNPISEFNPWGYDLLQDETLKPDHRRALLSKLNRPDFDKLIERIAADLDYRNSRGFGRMKVHQNLTREQMESLLKKRNGLTSESNFVNQYITRLQPNADIALTSDPDERSAYFDRLWNFVSDLNPSFNSLKANVLYNRLQHDLALGIFDKDRFMTYIKIPRNLQYMDPEYLRLAPHRDRAANLSQQFEAPLLSPIRGDEALVRDFLEHFFIEEDDYTAYTEILRDTFVKEVFATAKILRGLGDKERWASMLSPSTYRSLKERVEVNFLPNNPRYFSPEDAVRLSLDLKNVPELIVKVYEINTFNYFRENKQEVNLAIDLDGLVASREERITYEKPPEERFTESFPFPDLDDKRGIWVIEFIGNGISSRALVHKGRLSVDQKITAAGHLFVIHDEASEEVENASIWLAGKEYKPDEEGFITVPFSGKPTRESMILQDGNFCSLIQFSHQAESYQFQAGIHVDRESLLSGKETQIAIRPQLLVNRLPTTVSLLESIEVTIESIDITGTSSRKVIKNTEFSDTEETIITINTPKDLQTLNITVSAKVQNFSTSKKEPLRASKSFSMNNIETTQSVSDFLFSRLGDAYRIEYLGKNGEALADRPMTLWVKHHQFTRVKEFTLQTDENGMIDLGALPMIKQVEVRDANGNKKVLHPEFDRAMWPNTLQLAAGERLRLPVHDLKAEDASLFEKAKGNTVHLQDQSDAFEIKDGFLETDKLAAGDYELYLKPFNHSIKVRVTDGRNRRLEFSNLNPIQISSVKASKENIELNIENATEDTRVHLIATTFMPDHDLWQNLSPSTVPDLRYAETKRLKSFFESGRDIGDEYRYILERAASTKYPGNMLKRPGLILNPWKLNDTTAQNQKAEEGKDYAGAVNKPAGSVNATRKYGGGRAGKRGKGGELVGFPNLDFLEQPSVQLFNLTPDEDGNIQIAAEDLQGKPHLHLLVINKKEAVYVTRVLKHREAKLADRRLRRGLDPETGYTEQQIISIAAGDKVFTVSDARNSRFEVYGTLGKVFQLLETSSGNATLREFSWITNWPNLDEAQRLEKYSRYACHEINFFLHQKDPVFFAEVVRPYLQNKKDKTFLDHWLLENDLSRYLNPWEFQRLNHVEKILLAQREKERGEDIGAWIRDLNQMIPPNIPAYNQRFMTAIASSALESNEGLDTLLKDLLVSESLVKESEGLERTRGFALGGSDGEWEEKELNEMIDPFGFGDSSSGATSGDFNGFDDFSNSQGAPKKSDAKMKTNAMAPAPAPAMPSMEMAVPKPQSVARRSLSIDKTKSYQARMSKVRKANRQLYEKLDKTKEWAENNYWNLPIQQQLGSLIAVNGFWDDYASWDGKEGFLSTKFAEATSNFSEIMFALSVLDFHFEDKQAVNVELDGADFAITPGQPSIIFHKEIRQSETDPQAPSILVAQNFFQATDRYTQNGNERFDKFVKDEFIRGVVYGCQVLLTNPTSTRQKLDILLQIPKGAIPVRKGFETKGEHVILDPFGTRTFEYQFYFPSSGSFQHFPVNVARNEKLVAQADALQFNVVDKPTKIDTTSWDYVSQQGSLDEVLTYLKENNINRLDLGWIAWRMKDKAAFDATLGLLRNRLHYEDQLWRYGIFHKDEASTREWLPHSGFPARCGSILESPLLVINPVERHSYQHLEYDPLVSQRAHKLGSTRHITNDRFWTQYHEAMRLLTYKKEFSASDHLAVCYYLALQDRVAETMARFEEINREEIDTTIQYDYMEAYLSFYKLDLDTAKRIASEYADYPVTKWKSRFVNMLNQLDDKVDVADAEDREQRQAALANTEPAIDFVVEDRSLVIQYQNLEAATVNLYPMDIELLFSRNPFVQDESAKFSFIRPAFTEEVSLAADKTSDEFAIPEKYRNANLMAEVLAEGRRKAHAVFANDLNTTVLENYGQVQVTHKVTNKPQAKVYVKVFARMKGGQVQFFKDGYTDFRGRFDYVSLNTNELDQVERFSMLVLSEENGATIVEAVPPKR